MPLPFKLGYEAIEFAVKKWLMKNRPIQGLSTIPGKRGPFDVDQIQKTINTLADTFRKSGKDVNKVTVQDADQLINYEQALKAQKAKKPDMASGGRVGMFVGGPIKLAKGAKWFLNSVKKNLTDLKAGHPRFKDIPAEEQKMLVEGYETFIKQLEAGGEVPVEALEAISKNPQYYKTKKVVRSQDPDMAEVEELIDEKVFGHVRQELKDLETVGRKPNASGGIAGPLHLYDGGRARFDKGKKVDLSKRAFLKGTGATLGVLSALPFVGKFFKAAKPLTKVAATVEKAGAGTGMPLWFPKFIEKALKHGEDVSSANAPAERIIVSQTKLPNSKTDVYVEHDIVTGDTMVNIGMGKHGWSDGWQGQPTRLILKKGEILEEGKMKGQKTPDEFTVEEAEFTGGHPENVKFEESSFNKYGEHGSDFSELEEFATGKVTKESKAQKQVWEADSSMYDDFDPEDFAKGGRVSLSKGGLAKS